MTISQCSAHSSVLTEIVQKLALLRKQNYFDSRCFDEAGQRSTCRFIVIDYSDFYWSVHVASCYANQLECPGFASMGCGELLISAQGTATHVLAILIDVEASL